MPDQATLKNLVQPIFQKYPSRIAFVQRKKYRRKVWTYSDVEKTIAKLAVLFDQHNLSKGDRVAICSYNSPLWASLLLACAQRGIVLVPLDFQSTEAFIKEIVRQTKPKLYFTSLIKRIDLGGNLPIIYLEQLEDELQNIQEKDLDPVDIAEDDLLEIIFTSGSTGAPKGVMITHKNISSNISSLLQASTVQSSERFLSIIPLSHMLEQTLGLFAPLLLGTRIVYLSSTKPIEIIRGLQEEKITIVVCVPAFLRLFQDYIDREIKKRGWVSRFHIATSIGTYLPDAIKRMLFHRFHALIGGSLHLFFVGGAPLPKDTQDFWQSVGITVLQGYGLTEASPLVSVNTQQSNKRYSVGKNMPNQEIRLSSEGEIYVRGPNVTSGYYNNPKATQEAFAKEWLKTGDIGEIDEKGFLFIRGRKKNVIISEAGMKVYPEDIEQILNRHPQIKESVVLGVPGDRGIQITAALLPATEESIEPENIIRQTNEQIASHQKIQDYIVWPEQDFPRTSTRKIIRSEVQAYLVSRKTTPSSKKTHISKNPLLAILSEISGKPTDQIQPSDNLVTDLHLDSINRLELISRLEEERALLVDESQVDQNTTVESLEKNASERTQNNLFATEYDMAASSSNRASSIVISSRIVLCASAISDAFCNVEYIAS